MAKKPKPPRKCDLCSWPSTSLLCPVCADMIKRLLWVDERMKAPEVCIASKMASKGSPDKLLKRPDEKGHESQEKEKAKEAAASISADLLAHLMWEREIRRLTTKGSPLVPQQLPLETKEKDETFPWRVEYWFRGQRM